MTRALVALPPGVLIWMTLLQGATGCGAVEAIYLIALVALIVRWAAEDMAPPGWR